MFIECKCHEKFIKFSRSRFVIFPRDEENDRKTILSSEVGNQSPWGGLTTTKYVCIVSFDALNCSLSCPNPNIIPFWVFTLGGIENKNVHSPGKE